MPKDGRKLAIGLGIAGAAGALIYGITRVKAAPPRIYTCPVCDAEFSTLEELQYHFTTFHPREPIPIEWE